MKEIKGQPLQGEVLTSKDQALKGLQAEGSHTAHPVI